MQKAKASAYNIANDHHHEKHKAKGSKVTKLSSAEWDNCEKMPLIDLMTAPLSWMLLPSLSCFFSQEFSTSNGIKALQFVQAMDVK